VTARESPTGIIIKGFNLQDENNFIESMAAAREKTSDSYFAAARSLETADFCLAAERISSKKP